MVKNHPKTHMFVCVIFAFLIIKIGYCSQFKNELYFLLQITEKNQNKESAGQSNSVSSNKSSNIVSKLINFYQLFISTQDENSCVFSQSCSQFSKEAIQKFGVLHGLLITSDRLLRCHPLGRYYYSLDFNSHLLKDFKPDSYFLGKRK